MKIRTLTLVPATAVLAATLALAACGPNHNATAPKAAVSSAVANPTVQADEQAAARLVQSCVTSAHLADAKACLVSKVPPAKQAALKTCLAGAATTALGHPGSVKVTFKPLAQTCVAKALAS